MADSSILDELQWRGLIADMANRPELEKLLAPGAKPVTVYAGFDPTADSLHLGTLIPLFILRRFQLAGHRVIAVAGGATGMIGDPSGKSSERTLMSAETLDANIAGVQGPARAAARLRVEDQSRAAGQQTPTGRAALASSISCATSENIFRSTS